MVKRRSIDMLDTTWQRLRVNAAESNIPVRDYLTYLIDVSAPLNTKDPEVRAVTELIRFKNKTAVASRRARDRKEATR